jgi:trimeric autotransporter adhesin
VAAQSFLAKLGTRLSTLGSAGSLAFAFPLAEGGQGMDAHTAAARIGFYAVAATQIGVVVNGVDALDIGPTTITANVLVSTPATTSAGAGLNIGQGAAAPSSPNNGDVWITSAGMFAWVNGGLVGPFGAGGISGSGVAGRVTYWSGTTAITSSADFTFSTSTGLHASLSGSTNEMFGSFAGNATLTSSDCVFVGGSAGHATVSGNSNTYVGFQAGQSATTESSCTFVGTTAGASATGGGSACTFIGVAAGFNMTTSANLNNTSIGSNAMQGANGASGAQNTAAGSLSLFVVTTGSRNVAIGYRALIGMTSGSDSIAVGASAGQVLTASQTTLVGALSGAVLTSGAGNCALGYNAGSVTTTGTYNIFLGVGSGDSTGATASNRLVVGGNVGSISSVYVGNGETNAAPQNVVYNVTGGNGTNIAGASFTLAGGIGTGTGPGGAVIIRTAPVGSSSSTPNTLVTRWTVGGDGGTQWTGIITTSQPAVSAPNNGTIYYDSTAQAFLYSANGAAYTGFGGGGGISGSGVSGQVTYWNGTSSVTGSAGFTFSTSTGLHVSLSGAGNEMLGTNAGNASITGTDNILIGGTAGNALTSGNYNVVIGVVAGELMTSATNNTFVGTAAGAAMVTESFGTFIGANAGVHLTAQYNTCVGYNACIAASGATATLNVAVGAWTFPVLTLGSGNVALGYGAGVVSTTGNYNVFIGYNSGDATQPTASSRLVVGSSSAVISQVYIGNGETSASPMNVVYNATGAGQANTAGATFTIAGGIGAGTGIGGSIIFQTALAGSSGSTPNALATVFTMDQAGNIVVGNAAIATNATNGFLYLDSCAGPPTGTPTTFTGRVPIVIDTTTVTGKIWVYIGGTWRGIAVV